MPEHTHQAAAGRDAPVTGRARADPPSTGSVGDADGSARSRPGDRRSPRGKASRERGARTRTVIIEALLAILSECGSPATAPELAARAGVSVRLLFHHYRDLEAIYEAAFEHLGHRQWDRVPQVPPDLRLGARIDGTVKARARLFEAVVPLRRAARCLACRRPSIAAVMDAEDARLREWLAITFGADLASSGESTRLARLHAMELVASCEAWDRLRRVQGLSVRDASRAMATCLHALTMAEASLHPRTTATPRQAVGR